MMNPPVHFQAMASCTPVSIKGRYHPEDAVEQSYSLQEENLRSSSPTGISEQGERRASFQKTAKRHLRRNQKKTFDSLKEAAKSVESPARSPDKLIKSSALLHGGRTLPYVPCVAATMTTSTNCCNTRMTMATKIQALFRGFNIRKDNILRRKRQSTLQKVHRRQWSELTMSDWSTSDSFCSLRGLDLSPRANMRKMNEEVSCCHHMNNSSCTTMTMTMTENGDSLSSIFSSESVDLPVQRPRRKLTPPPLPPGYTIHDGVSGKTLRRRRCSTSTSVSPKQSPMTPDQPLSSVAGGRSRKSTWSDLLLRASKPPLVSPESCGTKFSPTTAERSSTYSPLSFLPSPSINKDLSNRISRPPVPLPSSPEIRNEKNKFVPPLTTTPARSRSHRRDHLTIRAATPNSPLLPFKSLSSKPPSRPRMLLTPERSKSKYVLPMTPETTPVNGEIQDDDDWKSRLRMHMMNEGLPLTSPRAEARINQNCNVAFEGHASMNSVRMSKLMGNVGCSVNDVGSSSARRRVLNEWGNASFSSYFAHTHRDEPIKAPRRTLSPTIQSKKRSLL